MRAAEGRGQRAAEGREHVTWRSWASCCCICEDACFACCRASSLSAKARRLALPIRAPVPVGRGRAEPNCRAWARACSPSSSTCCVDGSAGGGRVAMRRHEAVGPRGRLVLWAAGTAEGGGRRVEGGGRIGGCTRTGGCTGGRGTGGRSGGSGAERRCSILAGTS